MNQESPSASRIPNKKMLRHCPVCTREISREARICPGCGHDLGLSTLESCRLQTRWGIILLILAAFYSSAETPGDRLNFAIPGVLMLLIAGVRGMVYSIRQSHNFQR